MKTTRETSIDHAEDRVTVTRSSIETLNNKYRAKNIVVIIEECISPAGVTNQKKKNNK